MAQFSTGPKDADDASVFSVNGKVVIPIRSKRHPEPISLEDFARARGWVQTDEGWVEEAKDSTPLLDRIRAFFRNTLGRNDG